MNRPDDSSSQDEYLHQLAVSLVRLIDDARALANEEHQPNELADRVEAHLSAPPQDLPVISQQFPWYQLVDVQLAIDRWVEDDANRSIQLMGVTGQQRRFHTLSELLGDDLGFRVGIGPVDYVDVADSPDSTRSCVQFGLFLISDGDRRMAMLLRRNEQGPTVTANIEIISVDKAAAGAMLSDLRRLAIEHSVLRGQVLSLAIGEGPQYGGLRFIRRPTLDRDALVLPETTLSQIEGHVIGVAHHRERLLAAGQHLKRGVLLYGPPGTGKTHTVRYLLSRLTDLTAFVLSGQALSAIGQACGLARLLQPSLIVLEDVDLIAADRSIGPMGNSLLFEVLNQIDGLDGDVDVTFLLTTNRVDILERALSERPGRVDVAVEIAPPDEDGRRRLLRLYGKRLGVDQLGDNDLAAACQAMEGRTATYVREVVRRAALRAADGGREGALQVSGELLYEAASDLLADRSALTRSLLGGAQEPDAEPPLQMTPMRVRRGWVGSGRGADEPPPFGPEK